MDMSKQNRKTIKINEEHYEILKDYSESKGISMSESIAEMKRDIDILKAHELNTISENAIQLCDNFEAMTTTARLPKWLKDAIRITVRPIILQGMISNREIDFSGLRASWNVPAGMRLITCFDKE